MRAAVPRRVVRFDAFTLDLSRCVLLREHVEVALRRQAFDMLRYLAERPGALVTKEELVEAIWRKVAVSDDSLTRCVSDIRDALGDHDHRIVQTVRGRGYLLNVEVAEAASDTPPSPALGPDALAGQLARTGWLQAARTMPRDARVALVVCCVMAVAVVTWVLLTRTTAAPAPHEQAGHYAVLGRALMDREHTARANKEALVLFDKALALDPNSTLALLGYARVMLVDVTDGWAPREEHAARLNQAEAAIERAIKLDPKHARSYLLRGFLWRARGDPERALAAFQDALVLNPDYAWARAEAGRTKIDVGRADEAIQDIETAILLAPGEPRLFNWYYWLGMAAVHAGQSDTAMHWLLKGRQDDPLYYRLAMPWLAITYADLGREDDGRVLMAQYLTHHPTYALAGWSKAFPRLNPRVAAQRDRIAEVLRRLGVPDSNVRTGSVR